MSHSCQLLLHTPKDYSPLPRQPQPHSKYRKYHQYPDFEVCGKPTDQRVRAFDGEWRMIWACSGRH